MKSFLKKFLLVFNLLILLLTATAIVASFYIKKNFPMVTIDELYFYWTNGVTNSNSNVFVAAFNECYMRIILLFTLFTIIIYDITFGHLKLDFVTNFFRNSKVKAKDSKKKIGSIKKKNSFYIQLYPFKHINKHKIISTLVLILISAYIITNNLNCIKFIKNSSSKSKFIEINYVAPEEIRVNFAEKRNLIYIIVESLETTFFTRSQGGYWNYEVIPELYNLTIDKDSVAFYNTDMHEQMTMMAGTTWTTAGVVSNSTGLPFKIPIDGNEYHSENFMNGAYALGDMLKDNGYYNELVSSAKTNFGGIKEYYTKHGNYNIIDSNSLSQYGYSVNKEDYNGWGFNDRYLYEIAKDRLTTLSKQDKPFNLQLITIDTHFPDGFKYSFSSNKYNTQYENVYATSSKLLNDFIIWIKEQDFYKNTTIVILGDHISMQEEYFASRGIEYKNRYMYNCYINPAVEPIKNEERIYTELDTYPTIIAALGGEIPGNRLGLGVNLFSKQKTLAEKYGVDFLNEEILKKSKFYNNKILGSDYKIMIDDLGIIDEDEEKN